MKKIQKMINIGNNIPIFAFFLFICSAHPGLTAPPTEKPRAYEELIACRALTDSSARLDCYDAAVSRFSKLYDNGEIAVADGETAAAARKSAFGLPAPTPVLTPQKDSGTRDQEDIVESSLQSLRQAKDGKWIFVLATGAVWTQTDLQSIRTPKVGDPIRIRRGALGSFLATVKDRPAIRMKRLR